MRGLLWLMAVCLVPSMLLPGQSTGEMAAKSDSSTRAHASHDADRVLSYADDGAMLPPLDYRQWVFLTSGLDMSYTPRAAAAGTTADDEGKDMHMFDNVFVNPSSWRAFQQTGVWPDKTVFVLEFRAAESKVSINKAGRSQAGPTMGAEVHVKDAARGGWAFYEFDGDSPASMKPAKRVPKEASCYACHQAHAAADTTFVQFYPTLLPIAKEKGTLSAAYLKEESK